MKPADDPPKAVLYCWPGSFLSMVARLCLEEKGYNEDEYVLRHVDTSIGENFSPGFLQTDDDFLHGTLPALVIPTIDAFEGKKGKNIRKTHTLSGAQSICYFLDQARSPYLEVHGSRPAPLLSPISQSEEALTESLVRLVCQPHNDPNFIELSARNEHELQKKRADRLGSKLERRQATIDQYLRDAKQWNAKNPGLLEFLEEKSANNRAILAVYNGTASKDRMRNFFDASCVTWSIQLPATLSRLDELMLGPFALGDSLTLADCYVIVWLARLVHICGGDTSFTGINVLERHLTGVRIGKRLQVYWGHWVQRKSLQRIPLIPP